MPIEFSNFNDFNESGNLHDKVTIADFCPRIIVIDGEIEWVSTISSSHLIVNKLWLPSRIKKISPKSISDHEMIKSVVIEKESKLEEIESEAILTLLPIPSSIVFLGGNCFSDCGSFSSVIFESESILSRI
jgi:hypothetical protein